MKLRGCILSETGAFVCGGAESRLPGLLRMRRGRKSKSADQKKNPIDPPYTMSWGTLTRWAVPSLTKVCQTWRRG